MADSLKVGDDVRIKNYTGMDSADGWRIKEISGGRATIAKADEYWPETDPNAILGFTNEMRIGVDRLELAPPNN